MTHSIAIIGTGSYLPGAAIGTERVLQVLGELDDVPPQLGGRAARIGAQIMSRSGIRNRHFALDPDTRQQTETVTSMAAAAVRSALDMAGAKADSIDLLICAGPLADYFCPPTSALLQAALGIPSCTELEIHSNCTGAPKGLQVALDMLRSGRYRRAAVVFVQLSSAFLRTEYFHQAKVQLEHLALRWMLSDGAGAVLLDRTASGPELLEVHLESRHANRTPGMMGGMMGAFGSKVAIGPRDMYSTLHESGEHHVRQDIGAVGRQSPLDLIAGLARMLAANGFRGADVARFLLGIPGRHFISDESTALFRSQVGGDPERVSRDIEEFGYCGGAAMFIQLDRLLRSGQSAKGELIAAYLEESSMWMSGGFLART